MRWHACNSASWPDTAIFPTIFSARSAAITPPVVASFDAMIALIFFPSALH
jgi:hypothetical protein